jgi:Na+-driven multidrug efflux pump
VRKYDREILRLAVPALGALAAEPLYVLVDTAIVGHLGVAPLAALAIAGTLLTGAFTLFNFLTYGTTAQVATTAPATRTRRRSSAYRRCGWRRRSASSSWRSRRRSPARPSNSWAGAATPRISPCST